MKQQTSQAAGNYAILTVIAIGIIFIVVANWKPSPGPDPDPKPPGPTPVVLPYRVLIVTDQQSDLTSLPSEQLAIPLSKDFRDVIKETGADYRYWDNDEDLTFVDDRWRALMAKDRTGLPWIICDGAKQGFSGPLPLTIKETVELVRKYKP